MNTKNKLEFKLAKSKVLVALTVMKTIVNENIPATQAEIGVIFSAMTALSHAHDAEGVKDTVTISIPYEQACSIWHSCNVVIQNELYHSKLDETYILEVMNTIAPALDEFIAVQANRPKLELINGN